MNTLSIINSASIIIPTYNEEKYLPALLQSLKDQTIKPKEVIVVDAYSKDNTAEIVKRYGYKLVLSKKKGPAAQRNYGAQIATGKFFVFLDADVFLPQKTFLSDTITEMVVGKIAIATCLGEPTSTRKRDRIIQSLVVAYMIVTQSFFLHAGGFCIFVYRDIHERINGFDEDLFFGEDHDYVQRGAKVGKFSYLKSHKIFVSTRRLEEEGRWAIIKKYIGVELHLFFLGKVKKQIYEHKFGEHSK